MVIGGLDLTQVQILALLSTGRMQLVGQFSAGSNYAFLAVMDDGSIQVKAVYKPTRGENPLWDFPVRSLARRETAAYLLSRWLGWDLVPPTVLRRDALLGTGSLQIFIEHDPNRHYFSLARNELDRLKPAALFDLVVNNADRKGSHLVFDANDRLWLIDHGVCFNAEDKLRTVIWDFAGDRIPSHLLSDLQRACLVLSRDAELFSLLHPYLTLPELKALANRIEQLLAHPFYPHPPSDRRSYPYPPL